MSKQVSSVLLGEELHAATRQDLLQTSLPCEGSVDAGLERMKRFHGQMSQGLMQAVKATAEAVPELKAHHMKQAQITALPAARQSMINRGESPLNVKSLHSNFAGK